MPKDLLKRTLVLALLFELRREAQLKLQALLLYHRLLACDANRELEALATLGFRSRMTFSSSEEGRS